MALTVALTWKRRDPDRGLGSDAGDCGKRHPGFAAAAVGKFTTVPAARPHLSADRNADATAQSFGNDRVHYISRES